MQKSRAAFGDVPDSRLTRSRPADRAAPQGRDRGCSPPLLSGGATLLALSLLRHTQGTQQGSKGLVSQVRGWPPFESAASDLNPDADDNIGRQIRILCAQAPVPAMAWTMSALRWARTSGTN